MRERSDVALVGEHAAVTVGRLDCCSVQDERDQQHAEPASNAGVAELMRTDEHASQCWMC